MSMIATGSRFLTLSALALGCGGALSRPPTDAGPDVPADAAACGCHVDDYGLTMSWACFCAAFDCDKRAPACAPRRTTYPSCGLFTDTIDTGPGPYISVWDESGALVGRQDPGDIIFFTCPSDPSVGSTRLRAGRFPDPSCADVACPCTDGGTSCP